MHAGLEQAQAARMTERACPGQAGRWGRTTVSIRATAAAVEKMELREHGRAREGEGWLGAALAGAAPRGMAEQWGREALVARMERRPPTAGLPPSPPRAHLSTLSTTPLPL